MGQPKKRTSHRRTGARRSHLRLKLARAVNAKSPIKVYTTRREAPLTLPTGQAGGTQAGKTTQKQTPKPMA